MIGIRREDKNRWERRAPLTPDHVAALVREHGIEFRVQPSPIRAFPDMDYETAGARLADRLSECSTILGVKEVPSGKVLPGKTYLVFAHVIKGQRQNMPMLRRMLELGCSLVDYEMVKDDSGRRLLFFGRHAGHAGMIDALWALGQRLAREGFRTPFEQVRRAHEYSGLDEAGSHISRVGESLRHQGIPPALHPLVVGFTGSGNVNRGAVEIFDRLPAIEVYPEDLPALAAAPGPRSVVYRVTLRRQHRFKRKRGGEFDAGEFEQRPERYRGAAGGWLPYITALVHGAFWEPAHPRLVSREDLRNLWRGDTTPRLRLLADLSCDVGGAIEATVKATTPADPVYVYDPESGQARSGIGRVGPVVLAVDNLPAELPIESSEHFGDALERLVPALAGCDWDRPLDELSLPPEIARAVIVHRGKLAAAYTHLEQYLHERKEPGGGVRVGGDPRRRR